VAGSDARYYKRAFYSSLMLEEKAESIFDIINAIKSNKATSTVPSEEVL